MMNKVMLIGNLGNDPEIKISTRESKFAKLSISTHEKYKVDGEEREKTQWHNVVVFDPKLAEIVEKYYKKGQRIFVEGQLETRKYEHEGQTRYATEVVVPRFTGNLKIVSSKDKIASDNSETATVQMNEDTDIPF